MKKLWFSGDRRIGELKKYDNHDRSKKGDLSFIYKGVEIRLEVKSLQTHSVRSDDDSYRATFQCDASDRRPVKLPGGTVETTCLLVDEFDLLAVCVFQFGNKWQYAFAKNTDLPRTRSPKYNPTQQKYLLATSMQITWPLIPPYRPEPYVLLDEIVKNKTPRKKR